MSTKLQIFQIVTSTGIQNRQGHIVMVDGEPAFGVHQEVKRLGSPWTITHIPTGLAVGSAMSCALARFMAREWGTLHLQHCLSRDSLIEAVGSRYDAVRSWVTDMRYSKTPIPLESYLTPKA